MMDFSSET